MHIINGQNIYQGSISRDGTKQDEIKQIIKTLRGRDDDLQQITLVEIHPSDPTF